MPGHPPRRGDEEGPGETPFPWPKPADRTGPPGRSPACSATKDPSSTPDRPKTQTAPTQGQAFACPSCIPEQSVNGGGIRVACGFYYRPSTFRSHPIEWEKTVHADTGLLGLTTKHVYFAGSREKFRVRCDRIVSFDPYADGLGIMRDAQTAKPQTFVTGDGWFIYNLAMNLAQV